MKYFLYIFLAILLIACGDDTPKASKNFQTIDYKSITDENNHTVIKDIRQNLFFVNSKQGCKALHGEAKTALTDARAFCENLTFFGSNSWRVPTLEEMKSFLEGMYNDGLTPYYTYVKCKRTVAINPNGSLTTINTHNQEPKFKETTLSLPAGIRCVKKSDVP